MIRVLAQEVVAVPPAVRRVRRVVLQAVAVVLCSTIIICRLFISIYRLLLCHLNRFLLPLAKSGLANLNPIKTVSPQRLTVFLFFN